jgi:hypothetical protein
MLAGCGFMLWGFVGELTPFRFEIFSKVACRRTPETTAAVVNVEAWADMPIDVGSFRSERSVPALV